LDEVLDGRKKERKTDVELRRIRDSKTCGKKEPSQERGDTDAPN